MNAEEKHQNLIIKLPEDQTKVAQLKAKLEEYKSRLDEHQHPEVQHLTTPGAFYKATVLEELLKQGEVSTFDLSKRIIERVNSFNPESFNNACSVINDYVLTGGRNVIGGTGIPQLN